jgi:hypothetical protein
MLQAHLPRCSIFITPRCGKLLAMAFMFKESGGTLKKVLVARPGGKPTK